MAKRWVVGGIWAILMASAVLTCGPYTVAEQPRTPGKLLIKDVIIQGNRRMTTAKIKTLLHTQPGKIYSSSVVDDDVRELYKTYQFSNIITYLQEVGPGKVKICFTLREMPNLVQKVTFLGAKHVKPDELQNLTGIRPGMPLNPNLNHQGCQKIIAKYEELGRSFAYCQLVKGGELADTEVVYQITEGPKVKIRDIQFIGNTFVSNAGLATQMRTANLGLPHIGETYHKRMAEAGMNVLYEYYRGFGYQDVKIAAETQRSTDGREVTLIFHIQEGPRYRVKQAVRVETIPVWIPNRPGMTNIRYEVQEIECRIGKICVTGNKRISSESILAHVPLVPGKLLSYADLNQAEQNLAELGLFVVDAATGMRPTIKVVDVEGDDKKKDLLITVKEKTKTKAKRVKRP